MSAPVPDPAAQRKRRTILEDAEFGAGAKE
jgi:hypothetical protein